MPGASNLEASWGVCPCFTTPFEDEDSGRATHFCDPPTFVPGCAFVLFFFCHSIRRTCCVLPEALADFLRRARLASQTQLAFNLVANLSQVRLASPANPASVRFQQIHREALLRLIERKGLVRFAIVVELGKYKLTIARYQRA